MLSRRLQLPQSITRQWQRQRQQRQPPALALASFATSCPRESSSPPSLYEQLFPKKSPSDAQPEKKPNPRRKGTKPPESRPAGSEKELDNASSTVAQDGKTKKHSDVSKLFANKSSLGQWRQSLDKAKPEQGRQQKQQHSRNPSSPPQAVLVLSSASKSLMESDFYRIAHQGLHVDGWVRGLVKVAQARSPATQEPRGQYFLYFDTHDAAKSYSDKLERLHNLSRAALPTDWKTDSITGALLDGDTNTAAEIDTPTDVADLKTYTLLPPNASLNTTLCSADDTRLNITTKQAFKLPAADPKTRTQSPTNTTRHEVLIRLDSSKITTTALRQAIDADSRERNLAWKLGGHHNQPHNHDGIRSKTESADKAIRGVEASKSEIKWGAFQRNVNPDAPVVEEATVDAGGEGQGEGDTGKVESGFGRFVVSFAEPGEARRFVRAWHMRQIMDWRTERMVTLHVTGLW
ncbi:hypothetical protein B0T19DRAFT_427289 [Cercophora scortea]|uniref:Uncharacterized protein n=1 Tax=Cercophora scortea TaxID=314031 RepID=A0AAE0IFA1_9PEZI|nr:hypothetical protein B0T19DRAFT_427289 [Cercophora scortea]